MLVFTHILHIFNLKSNKFYIKKNNVYLLLKLKYKNDNIEIKQNIL